MPAELAAELAGAQLESYEAWVKAREESRLRRVPPWLERMLELQRRYVECFAPYDDPYDALLDDFEPGMRTDEVRAVFAVLSRSSARWSRSTRPTRRTSSCEARSRSSGKTRSPAS